MTDPTADTSIPLEITTITSGTEKIIAAEVEELIDSVGLTLRQTLLSLLDAMDTPPGHSRVLYPGAGVYARMTPDDIEWLDREHSCRVVPPARPQPMTNPAANLSITALSTWELQELIANAPHPCPLAALCDRRGWRRPSMADYAFIDACAERLSARLALAVSQARQPRQ